MTNPESSHGGQGESTIIGMNREALKEYAAKSRERYESALSGDGWFYRFDWSVELPGREPVVFEGDTNFSLEYPEGEEVRDDGTLMRRMNIVSLEREEVEMHYQNALQIEAMLESKT